MNKLLPAAIAILLALFVSLTTPSAAHAAGHIDHLDVAAALGADGTLTVTTTLAGEDLGTGITHRIDKRAPLGDLREFEYTISDISVASDGTPVEHDVDETAVHVEISLDPGSADEVTLQYRVAGAVYTPVGQGEMRRFSWPVVQGFDVGVTTVEGRLELMQAPPDFECRAGSPSALRACALWSIEHQAVGTPTFQDGPLEPGDVVALSASQPATAVADSSSIHTRWTLDRAFDLNTGSALASLAVLLLGGAALFLWHRRAGRDVTARRAPTVIGEFHPIGDGVSEFRVVEGIRPGQIGTVADETVDPVDITATILDLAVRGYLRIEQLQVPGGIDWTMARLEKPTDELHAYESLLLEALAPSSGERVLVSEIQDAVGPIVGDLQHELYDDVVAHGWFTKHPESARTDSRTVGAALLVVGLALTGVLAWLTTWGLVGVAVVAIGVASLFLASEMPRRSAKGSALLAGLHGFAAILAQQRTDTLPPGRELQEISRVLPYVVVLGGKDRWIKAMVSADDDDTPDPDALGWYHAPEDWHLQQLPQSLDALIASIQGHLFGR
ncbi:MAG: DUF2207 domain-containing protein [Propionibacterium sp.]|nr:DUF2207 domain-containing protein [Propionibacterium sp.]